MTALQIVLDHVDPSLGEELRALPNAQKQLAELFDAGRRFWHSIAVTEAEFFAYLAERLPADRPALASLGRIRGTDLYLACACARGDEDAVAVFRTAFLPGVRRSLARVAPYGTIDEACQLLMEKLFVGTRRRAPVISKYGGRGHLSAWIQIMATRDVLKRLGRQRSFHTAELEMLAQRTIVVTDPELAHLKDSCRGHFKRAFAVALDRLTVRQRNILRLEYVDKLNIDRIGLIYGVHRATVARWRTRARAALFSETRRVFEEELDVGHDEFDSILRLIRSQLDVSLPRLLRG